MKYLYQSNKARNAFLVNVVYEVYINHPKCTRYSRFLFFTKMYELMKQILFFQWLTIGWFITLYTYIISAARRVWPVLGTDQLTSYSRKWYHQKWTLLVETGNSRPSLFVISKRSVYWSVRSVLSSSRSRLQIYFNSL